MRTRALLTSLLAGAVLVLGLTACGGGSSSLSTGAVPSSSNGAETTAAAPAAPAHEQTRHDSAGPPAKKSGSGAAGAEAESRPPSPESTGAEPNAGPVGTGARTAKQRSPAVPRAKSSATAAGRGHRSTRAPAKPPGTRSVGGAAAFLQPEGDNSIPEYGSEAGGAESAAGQSVLAAYLDARAGGDWAGACAQMAASVQKQLGTLAGEGAGEGCVAAYAKLSAAVPAAERASPLVGSLAAFRVEGESAFALFYGPGAQQYMMPMKSEGGVWKVTQIAAIPYPPGAPAGGQ